MTDINFDANRRSLMKAMAGLAGSAVSNPLRAIAAGRQPFSDSSHQRLAVIGSGMGGVAAAWFCEEQWAVDLFEAMPDIGGHCQSRVIEVDGQSLMVDLGAQFFHPDTHPLYTCLLQELGILSESLDGEDASIRAAGSVSIRARGVDRAVFDSKRPLQSPIRAINFAIYTKAARQMIESDASYDLTIDEWLADLRLTKDFKHRLLLPWLAALIGTTIEEARQVSARSILQTFALAYPENIFKGAETWNLDTGLQGPLLTMLGETRNTLLRLATPIEQLQRRGDAWWLRSQDLWFGPYDAVVINAPPRHARTWFANLSGAEGLSRLLGRYRYFDTRISIHRDPLYVAPLESHWAVYNAEIDRGECEGSVWLGGFHRDRNGEPLQLFKSWTSLRSESPRELLAEASFKHPLLTPDAIQASRSLQSWQGRDGLWFSGQFTCGCDLQESAFFAGTEIAAALAPQSQRLSNYKLRLQAKGLNSVDYAL